MGSLFKPDMPKPTPPATMPDPYDTAAQREKRKSARELRVGSSAVQNSLAPVPGTIGREFSRSTLGAN